MDLSLSLEYIFILAWTLIMNIWNRLTTISSLGLGLVHGFVQLIFVDCHEVIETESSDDNIPELNNEMNW